METKELDTDDQTPFPKEAVLENEVTINRTDNDKMFSNAQLNQTVFHFESFEDPKKTLFGAKAESQSNYKTKMKLQRNKEQMVNTHLTRF